MEKKEILLKEYEVCQQDNIAASANAWTVISIFSSISIGSIGAVIYKTIEVNYDWRSLVLIIILSFMAIIVIHFLESWTKRATFLIGVNNNRMREIEKLLNMRKNSNIWEIDAWDDMPFTTKERIVSRWHMLCSKCENKDICQKQDTSEKKKSECARYKKQICNGKRSEIPSGLGPPATGRQVLSRFFQLLYIPWSLVILFSIVILGFKLVQA